MKIRYIKNGFFINDGMKILVVNIFDEGEKNEEEIKIIAERTLADCIAEKENMPKAEPSIEEKLAEQEQQIATLTECILEMSEYVYQ